ncbi:MAG TPA: class I SAM-dependent methyltransferase [Candidatus Sumerlaeota bacterium]|nr:class I SAM-dependent methyltransferase [Candidatus Sumerlaeota bacterium]HMX61776.1 class I SAM-dependent methyltransferase [Candidatus Sumerlaeota bacterium]HMZ50637.1 class I SAM-dependent methyltransferase [Candidatus Sumerlaeota bacterium]
MNGNTVSRVASVFANLAAHPGYIPGYLKSGPLSKQKPLDVELPWFSWAAIRFLDSHLNKSMHVFEYGSGGSTIYFAKRVASITSTEENPDWIAMVSERLKANGLTNATIQHRPYNFSDVQLDEFKQSDYLHSIPDASLDVIVVDGTQWDVPVRPTCFAHAETKIKPGGIIIFDDSWWHPDLPARHNAKSHRIFRSVGPCRAGVTSTDIYFY